MERCKNCGTKFPGKTLGKAEDKVIIKAIKEQFFLEEGTGFLMRVLGPGYNRPAGTKCGMVTLTGGRRVTLRCVLSVLNGGPLWKKDEKKKKK